MIVHLRGSRICDSSITSPVSSRLSDVTCRACLRLRPLPPPLGVVPWAVTKFGPTYLLMIVIIGTLIGVPS